MTKRKEKVYGPLPKEGKAEVIMQEVIREWAVDELANIEALMGTEFKAHKLPNGEKDTRSAEYLATHHAYLMDQRHEFVESQCALYGVTL